MVHARLQIAAFAAAFAAASPAWSVGGVSGADILKARLGARPLAMGETYAALGDDLASSLYNPSGLANISGPSLGFDYLNAIDQISYSQLAYAHPLFFGTLGLNLILRNQPDISNTLATDNPVSAYDVVLNVDYGQKTSYFLQDLPELLKHSSVGANLKWVRSHLASYDADSFALDLGARSEIGEGLILGVAALNLGPAIHFINVSDPLPATLLGGVSKSLELFKGNILNAGVDFEYPIYSDSRLHFGLEDWLGKGLALRAGYILESANNTGGLTAGMALRLDQETLLFELDYAWRPVYYDGFNSFDSQHLFSISLGF
jgi:hypothetical protein